MNTDKCIVDYCSNDTTDLCSARGLCGKHYRSIRRIIAKGITTWKQLEERGKVRPDGRAAKSNRLINWIEKPARPNLKNKIR